MSKVSVSVVSIVHVSATSASVSDLFLLGQMYLRSHLGHKLDHPRSANVFFLQMCFFCKCVFSVFLLPVALSPYAAVACSPHFGDCLPSGHCPADSPVSLCFHPQLGPVVSHFWQYFDMTW